MKRIIFAALVGVLVSGPVWAEPVTLSPRLAKLITGTWCGRYDKQQKSHGIHLELSVVGGGKQLKAIIDTLDPDSKWQEIAPKPYVILWDIIGQDENWFRVGEWVDKKNDVHTSSRRLTFLNDDKVSGIGLSGTWTYITRCDVHLDKPITTPTSPPVEPPQNKGDVTIEERLAKLKKLLDNGLITPDEAAEKRKEILKGL